MYAHPTLAIGDLIKFSEEKRPYRVRAVSTDTDHRYSICTKPFNPRRTVQYCIVDWYNGWRGPDNMVFCLGYETPEDISENLARLESGDMEVSRRRYAPLHIDWVNHQPCDYDHFTAPLWDDRRRWAAEHNQRMQERNERMANAQYT